MKKTIQTVICFVLLFSTLVSLAPVFGAEAAAEKKIFKRDDPEISSKVKNRYIKNYSEEYVNGEFFSKLQNVSLTNDPKNDLAEIALSQVGYYESSKNINNLSGAKDNKPKKINKKEETGNRTEYARYLKSQGSAWCQLFVRYCAEAAGISTKYIPNTAGAGFDPYKPLWKKGDINMYSWKDIQDGLYIPQKGDIVIFGGGSSADYNNTSDKFNGDNCRGKHVEILYSFNPDKEEYKLIGGNWSNRVDLHTYTPDKKTGQVREGYRIYAVVDISASYTPSYTVQYIANPPSGMSTTGSMNDSKMPIDKDRSLRKNAYKISGYTFKGWNTKRDGSGKAYSDGEKVKNLTKENGTKKLYAQWVEDYLSKCEPKIETLLTLKASNSKDCIMSFPCSSKTSKASTTVRRLTKDEKLKATGIYKNTEKNYWYEVTALSDEAKGYVYGGCVTVSGSPVSGNAKLETSTPKLGKKNTISGTINSKPMKIKAIEGVLTGSNGAKQTKIVEDVNATKYSIKSKPLDTGLKFAKLKHGPGTLQLTVTVTGKYTDGKKLGNVTCRKKLKPVEFTVIGSYDVKFDANGGSGAPASIKKTDLKDCPLPTKIPVRDGYTFLGWSTSKTAKTAKFAVGGAWTLNIDNKTGGTLTLYAVWEEDPTAGKIEISSTYFPDANMRNCLSTYCDTDKDGFLSKAERDAVTHFPGASENISDLTGIEYFTEITVIECEDNNLTTLDLSKNTKLTTVYCWNNNLTSIKLGSKSILETIVAWNNQLASLDLSNCPKLTNVNVDNNLLTSLDLRNSTKLYQIHCEGNRLESLLLPPVFDTRYSGHLLCSNNRLTELMIPASVGTVHCENNQLTTLDASRANSLLFLYCEKNNLTVLDLSNCSDRFKSVLNEEPYIDEGVATYTSSESNGYLSVDADVTIIPQPAGTNTPPSSPPSSASAADAVFTTESDKAQNDRQDNAAAEPVTDETPQETADPVADEIPEISGEPEAVEEPVITEEPEQENQPVEEPAEEVQLTEPEPDEPEPEVPEAVVPEEDPPEEPEPEVPEAVAAETVPETVEEPEEPQVEPEEPVLEEAPAPEPVKVEFRVDAKKAHVTVRRDDKKVKAKDDGSYLLLPGEYTYSVTADGYEPLDDIDFTVEEDDDLTIEITMTPIETETKDE